MKLKKIRDILNAKVIYGDEYLNKEINIACGCDLLSDVLAFTKPETLLLTGLINPQVVRTAEMVEISAICFVRGKIPEKATIKLAKEKKIPLLYTEIPMYESCGKLYATGLVGCSESPEKK